MIDKTVLLLTPLKDNHAHPVAKRIGEHLGFTLIFNRYFYQPTQQIFSRVILFDYETSVLESGITDTNRKIIEMVKQEKPDYVLWVAWGPFYEIREATFKQIRAAGTKVIGWFMDDDVLFDEYSKWWIPYLDYVVTNALDAVPKYQALGAWATQAMCTGTPSTRDWSAVEGKYDVTFIGRLRSDREQYINELKNKNIPLRIFGTAGERFLSDEEMIETFGSSKINLNFSKIRTDTKQIKGRLFEVTLAGGFLLTEYAPGIEKFFEIGKEIVCFETKEEMAEKIQYYLSHDQERRTIARAGWERASRDYSAAIIISGVFQQIANAPPAPNEISRTVKKTPPEIRQETADYYHKWGLAFLLERYHGLWKDSFRLSFQYYPYGWKQWYYYIFSFLPYAAFAVMMRLQRWGMAFESFVISIKTGMFRWADGVPGLREIKRTVGKLL